MSKVNAELSPCRSDTTMGCRQAGDLRLNPLDPGSLAADETAREVLLLVRLPGMTADEARTTFITDATAAVVPV